MPRIGSKSNSVFPWALTFFIPVYSYLSLTEESEYKTSAEEYAVVLENEQKISPGSPEFEKAMAAFDERMKHYRHERVYPTLPDWPVVCFYNMSKRRGETAQLVFIAFRRSAQAHAWPRRRGSRNTRAR